jgi:hypothetical protein
MCACGSKDAAPGPAPAPVEPPVAAASRDAAAAAIDAQSVGGHVRLAARAAQPTSLTADNVVETLETRYAAPILACFASAADGRAVSLSLSVAATGRATGTVHAASPTVAECLQTQIATWRFAAPKDGEAEPTTADFSVTMHFEPTPGP